MTALGRGSIVGIIGDIFIRRGAEAYLGEDVSMSQHMLQTALMAERDGAGEALVAAALLHDIGHFTSELPEDALERGLDNRHDRAGAAILARFFPPLVVDCARWHVAAKRYLCATDPGYFGQLSAASVHTLGLQGGPMGEAEAEAFAGRPHLAEILRVRRWDEAGKVPGVTTRAYADYAPLLQRLVDEGAMKQS